MNIKRILPMETNLVFRNIRDFVNQEEYQIYRSDKSPICFFLDAVTYNNLGDQAIALAMECFLNDCVGNDRLRVINESDLIKYIASLKKNICKRDLIVLSGGGNMGDLYPRYESLRRLVIKSFPENQIIVFPSTIDYAKDSYGQRELQREIQLYGSHQKLTVCARERKSYEILNGFCQNVLLIPDIVLYLENKVKIDLRDRIGIGIGLRDDAESTFDYDLREALLNEIKNLGLHYEQVTTMSAIEERIFSYSERKSIIQNKLNEFAKFEFIITDRLHGVIFSILSQTPCIVYDNKNHKVFGVCENIHHRNVICAEAGKKISGYIEEVRDKKDTVKERKTYKEFEELADLIRSYL